MKRVRLIYSIVLSVALILAGLCLMGACLQVYQTGGEQIYTPEKIAAAFAPIAVPVYLALALAVGGFLLWAVSPAEGKKAKLEKNYPLILRKLHEKQDISQCGDEKLRAAVAKEQNSRKLHRAISLALLAAGTLAALVYSANTANFPMGAEITGAVMKFSLVLLICMGIPFGYGIFAAYYSRASIRREIDLMKLVAAPRTAPEAKEEARDTWQRYLSVAVLCLAVILIVYGYSAGGWTGVVTKAINICKECVGLG